MIMESIQFNVTKSDLDTINIQLDTKNSRKTRAIFTVAAQQRQS